MNVCNFLLTGEVRKEPKESAKEMTEQEKIIFNV